MTLSEELQWRGFINQTTFNAYTELDDESRTFYWGVDPSAPSMTIGNLAAAMMARVFISHGWNAVLLVGGATGMIGDPDGKRQERSLKNLEEIANNKKAIAAQYSQVFDGLPFKVVDNYDWFKGIGYLDFLRTVGKHVSITQMLDRSFVQDRIGEGGAGISYAEFSYSLIQGYDFLHLFREHGVTVQLCGADQWGNSIAGVDLIRRVESGEAHILSCPLIVNKSTGVKFGKSEEGAVWLDSSQTSVFDFYQFWLNVDDAGVLDYLRVYTTISKQELEEIEAEFTADPAARAAQKELAYRVTAIVHGVKQAEAARKLTGLLFSNETLNDSASDDAVIALIRSELPVVQASNIIDAVVAAGYAQSKGAARKLIESGAVKCSGEAVKDTTSQTEVNSIYRVGKNRFFFSEKP